jgi:hypothetical protein
VHTGRLRLERLFGFTSFELGEVCGWVEPTGPPSAGPMINSAKPIVHVVGILLMVFASLYPSSGAAWPVASSPGVRRDTTKISQLTMNIAAINGPMTKPLRPNTSMPPSVEISTT